MAIKISNSTIVDDSRNIVDAGISTFVGVGTFQNDLYVGGTLHAPSLTGGATFIGDDVTTRNLSVSGISTFSGDVEFIGSIGVGTDTSSADITVLASGGSFPTSDPKFHAIQSDGSGLSYAMYIHDGRGTGSGGIDQRYVKQVVPDGYWGVGVPGSKSILFGNMDGITLTGESGWVDSDVSLKINPDTSTELRYAYTKKLETASSGINVVGTTTTGQLSVTGVSTFNGNAYFGDFNKIYFGDGNDLRIYHGATGSYISEQGNGKLNIIASDIEFTNTVAEKFARFNYNTSVELYYADSKKIETTTSGVNIVGTTTTGQLSVTGVTTFISGGNGEIKIHEVLGAPTIEKTGGGSLNIKANNNTDILVGSNYSGRFGASGGVSLFHSGIQKFGTTTDGINIVGTTETDQLNVTGVSTFVGILTTQNNAFVGNDLSVAGNARIVGVLTVGSSSVTLNGDTNTVSIGDGVTLHTTTASVNQLQVAGIATFQNKVYHDANAYFGDTKQLLFGDGPDYGISYNGTNLFISHQVGGGGGNIYLQTPNDGSGLLQIRRSTFHQRMATFNDGGSVDLYYNDSKKFETTSSGVSITGNAEVSGDLTVLGTLVYEDVTNVDAVYISTARSGLRITDGGLNVVGVSTFQTGVDVVSGGIDVYTGGTYKINSADVLSATTLGAGVTNSSLTTVGAGVISNRAELTVGQPSGSDYILLYDADVGDLKKATISNAALQGVQGPQGTQGVQGIQGVQGVQGTQGTQGTQGSGGTQGTQGLTGIQGTFGAQGTQGTQGIQGIQGITGTQGIQGSTSYDAGTLDGLDSADFLRSNANDNYSGILTLNDTQFRAGTNTSHIRIQSAGSSAGIAQYNNSGTWLSTWYATTGYYGFLDNVWGNWDIKKAVNGNMSLRVSGTDYTVWHAGNDGSGSGLDADTLDGYHFSVESGPSAVGNFGQWQGHNTYSDFNTVPSYWGWNYVQGNTNAPNTNSSQWYRSRLSLGSEYGFGSDSGDYWLEMAIPRSNYATSAGGLWLRTCENGAEQPWREVGSTGKAIAMAMIFG